MYAASLPTFFCKKLSKSVIRLSSDDNLVPPPFLRKIFVELMQAVTSSVELSFNNTKYRQTHGIPVVFQLGQSLLISFLVIRNTNFFSTSRNFLCSSATLMTPLRYLSAKTNVKIFFLHSIFFTLCYILHSKKNLTLLSCFLTCWLRSTVLDLLHLCKKTYSYRPVTTLGFF